VLLLCLGSCKNSNEKSNNSATTPVVNFAIATERSYTEDAAYSGTFFANKEANLGASMPGKIEKFHYAEGSYVTAGTLLVELSAELLTQALIEYEAIKKDFERVSRLREKGSISELEYDHLKAKLEASEVKTQMLKKNTSVTAPFDGVIVEYLVEEGENYFFNINLEPGYSNTSGILRLMQLNPLVVKIEVNENDLGHIAKNQSVKIMAGAENTEYTGRVSYIKPILSTLTRTATVEIEVNNSGGKIKPGMFARVVLTKNEMQGVFVPVDAIYRQPGTPDDFVYTVENGIVSRRKIQRIKTIDNAIVVSGIEAGDTVVTQGKNRLRHGDAVKLKTH